MIRYILHRLLLAVPTLLIISLVTFALGRIREADPVHIDFETDSTAYRAKATNLGLDQPEFYLTLTAQAFPDSVYRIFPLEYRKQMVHFTRQNGNWAATQRLWNSIITAWELARRTTSGPTLDAFSHIRHIRDLQLLPNAIDRAKSPVEALADDSARTMLQAALAGIRGAYDGVEQHPRRWKLWVPALHWHGTQNQYHQWLSGFLSGDPGNSLVTGNPMLVELRPRLLITLSLNGMAILLAYLIGVPLGVFMARHDQRPADRWTRAALLFLYAMPIMWLGGMLTLLLSRPDTGLHLIDGLNAEPWLMSNKTFGRWFADNFQKFILPVLTLTLHTLAIIALQMRGGILEVVQQDFIRTARAKGLNERLVFWRHAFRNGLFPIITVFASFFPSIFSGSLVVEYLFDFPGMGIKMESAFANHDYPVLFAMVMFVSALTIIGSLIADMLYAWVDPRVRFAQ